MLVDILRKIPSSGPDGFEGLFQKLLSELTGRRFRLARSGAQEGRDLSMRHPGSNVVAVECKRFGTKTELRKRMLLGGMTEATGDIPDLDLWVLVTSRDVPSQLEEALQYRARKEEIAYYSISADDGKPSTLEALCAEGADIVLQHVTTFISSKEKQQLRQELDKVVNTRGFKSRVDRIKETLLSPSIGYDNWRADQNRWLLEAVKSETESHARYGQILNVEDEDVQLIERKSAWAELDNWHSHWSNSQHPFVMLGEEGDGKTWCVASWLSQNIRNRDDFPPVIFMSSPNSETNEPLAQLSKSVSRVLGTLRAHECQRRVMRWIAKPATDAPRLLLVLDGINERRESSWWRESIDRLAGEPWHDSVALIVTCRTTYWERYFANLRYLKVSTYELLPYDDGELEEALTYHRLSRSDIPNELMSVIRKPRYFDLMVKHRERVAESGDFTIARLIYEDWRDRLERKSHIQLDDRSFQDMIKEIASRHQQENYITNQSVQEMIPSSVNKNTIIEELRTSGILRGQGTRYKVDEEMVVYGFGLLLADRVREEASEDTREPGEIVAEWLEPQTDMDIKSKICEFAALHALTLSEFPRNVKVSLLFSWINTQSPGANIEDNLSAYVPVDPDSYFELSEAVWSDATENSWAQELLMRSFLRWRNSQKVKSRFPAVFERWLGFVHPHGSPFLRGQRAEHAEKVREEISDRLGFEPPLRPFKFAGRQLTGIDDDGLLRLGRVALAVISHMPRGPYLRAIATGCVAEAVMGYTAKYDLFKWVMITSGQSVWNEVKFEVQQLMDADQLAASQAAYRLLSFEGSSQAQDLKQRLPKDLFPPNPMIEQHKKDPCTSGFAWSEDDCLRCLQRSDLPSERVARSIRPHCINPNLEVPDDLGIRLSSLTSTIDPDSIWLSAGTSANDFNFENYETALCAYAPEAIADLVRRIARGASEREGFALRQLAIQLIKHHLILARKEHEKILFAWTRLMKIVGKWGSTEKLTEMYLFNVLLKGWTDNEQLFHLLRRPSELPDWVNFESSLLPVSNWRNVWKRLAQLNDVKAIDRLLWFVSANPDLIPKDDIYEHILPLIRQDDSLVRAHVLKILFLSKHKKAIKEIVESLWAWDDANLELENMWGSLLLSEHGSSLQYRDLRSRILPHYLGYAVRCRGTIAEEVDQYAQDIHSIWHRLGSELPDLPRDFPPTDVDVSQHDVAAPVYITLSDTVFSKTATYVSRDAFWGGENEADPKDFLEAWTLDDEQLETLHNIAFETIDQQRKAGNLWLGRHFPTDALDQVIKQRRDLVDNWLKVAFSAEAEERRVLSLGRSFYEALCAVLLQDDPEMGVLLFRKLQETDDPVRIVDHHSGMMLLDYDLFSAPSDPKVEQAWAERIGQCKNDRDLMGIATLAPSGNVGDWLWSYIVGGLDTSTPLEIARSIVLLGFYDSEKAQNLLLKLLEETPDTWIKILVTKSLHHWKRNTWAKHWFRQFLDAVDDVVAWSSFKLFLECSDTRFWVWFARIRSEAGDSFKLKSRLVFLDDNINTIKNRIRKNERPLTKSFLGHKTLEREVWPWL